MHQTEERMDAILTLLENIDQAQRTKIDPSSLATALLRLWF